jgi:SAM-dependent MidA family methyltransferase
VDAEGSRLLQRLGPLSREALFEPARAALSCSLPPGSRLEVRPDLPGWCRDASAAVERGYLLVIDYGDVEPDLWLRNPDGTLVTYGPDGFGQDPLAAPGLRDITADVDFSAVARAAQRCGFEPQGLTTQRAWLRSLGLDAVVEELDRASGRATARGLHREALGLDAEVSELLALVGHMGLGDMMVFRAARGAPAPGLPT